MNERGRQSFGVIDLGGESVFDRAGEKPVILQRTISLHDITTTTTRELTHTGRVLVVVAEVRRWVGVGVGVKDVAMKEVVDEAVEEATNYTEVPTQTDPPPTSTNMTTQCEERSRMRNWFTQMDPIISLDSSTQTGGGELPASTNNNNNNVRSSLGQKEKDVISLVLVYLIRRFCHKLMEIQKEKASKLVSREVMTDFSLPIHHQQQPRINAPSNFLPAYQQPRGVRELRERIDHLSKLYRGGGQQSRATPPRRKAHPPTTPAAKKPVVIKQPMEEKTPPVVKEPSPTPPPPMSPLSSDANLQSIASRSSKSKQEEEVVKFSKQEEEELKSSTHSSAKQSSSSKSPSEEDEESSSESSSSQSSSSTSTSVSSPSKSSIASADSLESVKGSDLTSGSASTVKTASNIKTDSSIATDIMRGGSGGGSSNSSNSSNST